MDVLAQDLRYALTSLRRDLGFAAVTVLTLALGVGINTAVFTVVRSTLLDPLPYPESDRLAMVWTRAEGPEASDAATGYADVEDWRARNRSFEDLAAFDPVTLTLTGGEFAEQVSAARVSANLFAVLRTPALLGRSLSLGDEEARTPVAVLSHGFWMRRFGGAPDVIGSRVELAGSPYQVIGVMPQHFAFPDADIWLPATQARDWDSIAARRGTDSWRVVGRLRDGVTLEQATADLQAVAASLQNEYPATNTGLSANVVPLLDQLTGASYRRALWMLFGAVGFVLMIACANAAHLILARGIGRAKELTIRFALGASTRRIVRQTVTECLVLSLAAGVLGTAMAYAGVEVLRALAPANTPRIDDVGLDAWALAYASVVSIATGVVFGVLPVLRHARGGASYEDLRDGRSGSEAHRTSDARRVLIVGQCALAIVLVFGANLLIRSFLAARAADLGFEARGVFVANLSVESPEDRVPFYESVVRDVAAIPGVRAAAAMEDLIISSAQGRTFSVEGSEVPRVLLEEARVEAIEGDLATAIGVPMVEGRGFGPADGADGVPVAIVNETMARRLWPGTSPIGRRFTSGDPSVAEGWVQVVGVIGDMRRQGPERDPIPQAFRPFAQAPSRNMNLLVRADRPPAELAAEIRSRVVAAGPSVPFYGVTTVEELLGGAVAPRRFESTLLGSLAFIALVLAAAGVHGLMQYSVSRRTREIGVRMALGARARSVSFMVIREGLALVLPGLALGALAASWLSDLMSSQLYGVRAADGLSVFVTGAVLVAATVLACYVPARRASRVDPIDALRR